MESISVFFFILTNHSTHPLRWKSIYIEIDRRLLINCQYFFQFFRGYIQIQNLLRIACWEYISSVSVYFSSEEKKEVNCNAREGSSNWKSLRRSDFYLEIQLLRL